MNVENMILVFEEDSVLSMISHGTWELEGKEGLKNETHHVLK